MVDKKNPQLAINGGEPVSKTKIPLYKPTIEEDDIDRKSTRLHSRH